MQYCGSTTEGNEMNWDQKFMNLAALVASWSKDPSTQVGCVLVNEQRVVVGMGYNGFPRGVEDTDARLNDRSVKYMMVQHAEANAIFNSTSDLKGATAYVTHSPCANCAGALIQSGVTKIVTNPTPEGLAERFAESFAVSSTMLGEAGVELAVMDS